MPFSCHECCQLSEVASRQERSTQEAWADGCHDIPTPALDSITEARFRFKQQGGRGPSSEMQMEEAGHTLTPSPRRHACRLSCTGTESWRRVCHTPWPSFSPISISLIFPNSRRRARVPCVSRVRRLMVGHNGTGRPPLSNNLGTCPLSPCQNLIRTCLPNFQRI